MTKAPTLTSPATADDLQAARAAAHVYARAHLKELASDLDALSNDTLKAGSRLEALSKLCREFGGSQARNCAIAVVNACLREYAQATAPAAIDVDALAQEIRRVDGAHSLGAGALAEALLPYLVARGVRSGVVSPKDLRESFKEGYFSQGESNLENEWSTSNARVLHDAVLKSPAFE